jgi:hypothetical protein
MRNYVISLKKIPNLRKILFNVFANEKSEGDENFLHSDLLQQMQKSK